MKYPLVTVLMALYNGSRYVAQTVRSVLGQTYSDFEFLIINDCSTDNSLQIVKSFHDKRIKIHDNVKNIGQTKSLNIGLRLANGDYIARMDADDVALPEWLETQAGYMEENPAYSVVSSYAIAIDEQNKIKKLYKPPINDEEIILRSLITSPIHHVGSVFKRKDVLEVGGYNERYIIACDYALWGKLIRNKFKITTTPRILVAIREHAQSTSQSNGRMQDFEETREIVGNNLAAYTHAELSDSEINLFCRANYDSDNLTPVEFDKAVEATKKVYMNLALSPKVGHDKMVRWTRKRCEIIYAKRIFSVVNRTSDSKIIRGLALRAMKEIGLFNVFTVITAVSFFGKLLLRFFPHIYNKILRQKACIELNNEGRDGIFK